MKYLLPLLFLTGCVTQPDCYLLILPEANITYCGKAVKCETLKNGNETAKICTLDRAELEKE